MSECVVWSESATVRTLPRRKPTGRVRFMTPDGMWHVYLNEAIPARGSIIHSPCDKCGFGYSEIAMLLGHAPTTWKAGR